ncbi:MAG: helix-turn-helix transcriptional regulator [Gemmatimonadales bacterium]|nr:helix-turn-helix transcriptional regulator [Gemmatimonadales bacterium]
MLSRREGQVLQLIAEGKSIRPIATLLGIADKTAEHHREHIRRKLGVRTTAHLVRWAIRMELVVP